MKFSELIKPISYLKPHASEVIRDVKTQESMAMHKILALSGKNLKSKNYKPFKQTFKDVRLKIDEFKMKQDTEYINEEELFNKAIAILNDKLGPLDTSRFLSITSQKRMESIKRHQQWQAKLDKAKVFKEIFE